METRSATEPVQDLTEGILPYSAIVGQEEIKRALELVFIAPAIGGVLLTGQRGTAKSTAARAFAAMVHGELPVTLPINATDDRVIGGWHIDELMAGRSVERPGLLVEATERGMLYVDEVNLLDDHIVNLILDATSTGILPVQREMQAREQRVRFSLVGTMNPEEGSLRPQLLDRFGLMVNVRTEVEPELRQRILETVLRFDEARAGHAREWLAEMRRQDKARAEILLAAQERLYDVDVPSSAAEACAKVATCFEVVGHRAEYVTALGARALAALDAAPEVSTEHIAAAAPLALAHRTASAVGTGDAAWSAHDAETLQSVLRGA